MSHVIDATDFVRDLERAHKNGLAAIKQVLGQSASLARDLAASTTAFKDRSTKLRSSIRRVERGPWEYDVIAGGADAPWGKFVEEGTDDHVIEAKKAKALRFFWAGELTFMRRVHHPGTKPTNFMRDARDRSEDAVGRFIEAGLGAAFG